MAKSLPSGNLVRVVCLSEIKSVCLVKNKARFLYELVCMSSKSTELGV